jgi:Phosphotransferase enzyme family
MEFTLNKRDSEKTISHIVKKELNWNNPTLNKIQTLTDTLIYEITQSNISVILKAGFYNSSDLRCIGLEGWAYQEAKKAGVIVPNVLALDTTKRDINFDYIILDKVQGCPLNNCQLSILDMKDLLKQTGHYLYLLHSIKLDGYGWLDKNDYSKNHQIKGMKKTWKSVLEKKIKKSLLFLKTRTKINAEVILTIEQLIREYNKIFDITQGCFLHGDMSLDHVYIDPVSCRITGIIDFGDCQSGDPLWDLIFDDFRMSFDDNFLLEGYLPNNPEIDFIEIKLILYKIFRTLLSCEWWCKKGYIKEIDVLECILHEAKKKLRLYKQY